MVRAFSIRTLLPALAVLSITSGGLASDAQAQWSTTYEQFYMPGRFNWQFRHNYPAAERLFNAFDYGHAILYEKLWTNPAGALAELEKTEYDFITRELLVHPPNVALEESAIEVAYAKLVPEAKAMFDWAHLLHRQIYDVWSDERMTNDQRDAKVQELIRYYKTRPELAFSSKPKTMELMEGQPYSTAFRKNYPKFNGLIWAYHWLQVGLYEPLVIGKTAEEKQAGVAATVTRFRQMMTDPPSTMPYVMPMTAAIAPEFSKRYPEAAIIFDNLHSMHDVVSDVLANPSVPRDRKRAEIVKAGRLYRDATSFVQSIDEWREMAQMMGVENMGGPAVNFLPALPKPTVARGAVMAGMDHANMPGMRMNDSARADHPGMKMPSDKDSSKAVAMDHSKMPMAGVAKDSMPIRADSMMGMDHTRMHDSTHEATDDASHQLMMLMMADPVIRKRVMADTALRRMVQEMIDKMPAEHREHMESMKGKSSSTRAAPSTKTAAKRKSSKPTAPQKDRMKPGMDHSKMPNAKKKP
ncbi:MAG: hypothetical protein ABI877_07590 [Gemmatimonadaceae bacterium]